MSERPEEMAERHSRMLAEVQALTLSAARILHARLETAETSADARDLGLAFNRITRALRQAVLLEAKLANDRRKAAREDAEAAVEAAAGVVKQRKARVHYAVGREILEGCETQEQVDALMGELVAHVDEYVEGYDFETGTLAELVAILSRDLGVPQRPSKAEPGVAAGQGGGSVADPPGAPPSLAPRLLQGPDLGWAPAPESS